MVFHRLHPSCALKLRDTVKGGGELGRSYEQLCSQVTDFPSFARAPLRPHWGTDSFGIIVCESLKRDYPFWENESAIRILESARGKMLHLCILGREG